MVAMTIYSVTMVLWKETAFPLCRAMERRWKRNVVSRPPISRRVRYDTIRDAILTSARKPT